MNVFCIIIISCSIDYTVLKMHTSSVLFLLVFTFIGHVSYAQYEDDFKLKFDLGIYQGISFPISKFSILSNKLDDRSSAGLGTYTQVSTSFLLLPKSPWRIQFELAYMHNFIKTQKSKELFSLESIEGNDWTNFYLTTGINYKSKGKVYYDLGIGCGLNLISGGITNVNEILQDTLFINDWSFKINPAFCIRAFVGIGIQITKKIDLGLRAHLTYSSGIRYVDQLKRKYFIDQGGNISNQYFDNKNNQIQNETTISAICINLGLCVSLYEDLNDINKIKFNQDE